jgi:hypothetical protein
MSLHIDQFNKTTPPKSKIPVNLATVSSTFRPTDGTLKVQVLRLRAANLSARPASPTHAAARCPSPVIGDTAVAIATTPPPSEGVPTTRITVAVVCILLALVIPRTALARDEIMDCRLDDGHHLLLLPIAGVLQSPSL